jgi:Na+-translocating ferredoxin:NAD+ oxidoreductase RnfC subunit
MKLKLQDYDVEAPFNPNEIKVNSVRIPFQQHIGKPAQAVVKKGELVKTGQLIGKVPEGELGANVHSSINGKVKEATSTSISIDS